MVSELMNVENISTEFCIYEVEYKVPEARNRQKVWITHRTFYNLTGDMMRALRCNYRYAIDRQIAVARRYRVPFEEIILLCNRLVERKLLPLSLAPKVGEVRHCRIKRHEMKALSKDQVLKFKSVKLYQHTFRVPIISFLEQKRKDIYDSGILGETSQEVYGKMVKVFADMNTDTSNHITFDEAVDKLYEKTVKTMSMERNI